MKQKLISKLKRVALAFFAALCVGNVWAADFYGGEYHCYFDINTKTITATSDIWAYSARTYIGYYTFSYTDNTGAEVTESIYGSRKSIGAEDWGTLEDSFTLPNFKLGSSLSVVLKIMYVSNNQYKDITDNWEPNPRKPVVFETAKVMSTKCEWTNNPKKFIVSGVSGSPKVKIEYAIGDSNLSESDVVFESKTLDVLDANFSLEIPYESEEKIFWRAYAVFEDESEELFINGDNVSLFSRERIDDTKQTYTWTGNGDGGSWKDVDNWVSDASSSFGYPGTKGGAYYRTMVRFDGNAEVDLDGESFGFVDDGAFAFAENATVKFKNGHIYAASGHLGVGGSDDAFGADGVTIIFNNIGLHLFDGENFSTKGCQEVTPRSNTTLVFEGDFNKNSTLFNDSSAWRYHPKKTYSNTKFVFKDGEIRCGYVSSADYSMSLSGTHKVEITNAIFRINTNADGAKYGVADEVIFRNGVDSGSKQARLWIYNSSSNMDGKIKLPSVLDIKLPETPYSTAYIQAYSFIETPSSTIKIDATDYVKGEKVPLIKLTEASTYIPTLKVFVNGEETTARNAKLVWEGTTLYFQQDSLNAASIGATEYATLGEAVEAATSGATITVLNDCTADTACVIANKTLTIDLNGKTVKANDTAAATDGNGVFWVQAGGVLTLEDSSEEKTGTVDGNGGNDYKMAIWADGGKVVINAGNYVNDNDGTQNQYDLIYVKNGGEIVINGGTFKCDSPRWTLNSHNTKTGTFVVTGGKFYQYNPTDFDTDEAVTTWCDAKYRAEADGDWYVIKEGYIVTTEPEASAVTVTADTEAEALAQVDFSVTTPEGVDATAYKNYFKLVATETAEGSKTWIVALALKDELKPVIAETTPAITFNENGTVTVNIENELPGLNYGVRYATTVEAVETATPVAGFTVTPAEGDTAGFFKVVVDFKEIK